eukprot:sb/3477587/
MKCMKPHFPNFCLSISLSVLRDRERERERERETARDRERERERETERETERQRDLFTRSCLPLGSPRFRRFASSVPDKLILLIRLRCRLLSFFPDRLGGLVLRHHEL